MIQTADIVAPRARVIGRQSSPNLEGFSEGRWGARGWPSSSRLAAGKARLLDTSEAAPYNPPLIKWRMIKELNGRTKL